VPTKGRPGFTGISAESSPVEYGGTLYLPDSKSHIWAVDASTGERIWVYTPKFPKGFTAGSAPRGVAIGDGKVYFAQPDASVTAIDSATGRATWHTKVGNFLTGASFTAAPTYWHGLLITALSGGDGGARCKIVAINAKTGKIKWQFYTIPNKGDPGYNTWPSRKAWDGGGAMWNTPSIDPKLGLVYVGVGNPIPYSALTRGPGQELFTESILALHLKNGKYAWHFQTVHHDIWDYDIPQSTILFDAKIKGTMRHGIVATAKTGWLYILDRRTGKLILGINEKPVPQSAAQHTWPTQPIPVGQPFSKQCADPKEFAGVKAPDGQPYKVGCLFTPYDDTQFSVFAPGVLGGADWPVSSYSPQTGYEYICGKDGLNAFKSLPQETILHGLKARGNFFQVEGVFPPKGTPMTNVPGTLTAMDLRTNRMTWQVRFPNGDMCYSGAMSTNGNLVFLGRNDGRLQAYNSRNGKLLWSSPKLLASPNAAAITYRVNGRQYVAVYAGGNAVAGLFGRVPGRYGSDLYAFALPQ